MAQAIDVLYVDDEPDFAEMAATSLEREHDRLSVRTATSAANGLDLLADHDIDCIVSDYDMPNMDGIEFLETVREEYPDLPFILLTKGSEAVANDAVSAGVTDYLRKEGDTDQFTILANRITNAVEYYRSEQRVKRNERRLREIIDHLPHLLYVVDEDSQYLLANETLADFHDTTPAEMEGTSVAELHDDSMYEQFHTDLQEVLASGNPKRVPEVELTDATGTKHVFEARLLPYEFADTRAVLGIAVDITERKGEREPERYEAALETVPEGVAIYDANLDCITVNQALVDTTGIPREEFLGESAETIVEPLPEDQSQEWLESMHRLVAGEQEQYRRSLTFETDGEEIYADARTHRIDSEAGELLGVVNLLRDVTERKTREREFQQYKTIVETVPEGVFVIDENGTILTGNRTGDEMLGYAPGELYGEPFRRLVAEGVVEKGVIETYLDHVRAMLSSDTDREEAQFEYSATVDGEERVFETHLTLRPFEDEFRGTIGVFRDVTEQKQRQQELRRQNERLEKFAHIVSHDLRNPLNVAQGHLDLAQSECDSEHLDTVMDAHERIETLINDLLTLARKGETVNEPDPVDLAALIDACWQSVETAEATLRIETDSTIRADQSRLQQLLENLIANAVEHGGSDVTITVGELDDRGFYIEDDGPGIPESDRDRVLESGYSTTEDDTGLGLSIVQEIATAHDWELTVTESETRGARFEITGVEFVS